MLLLHAMDPGLGLLLTHDVYCAPSTMILLLLLLSPLLLLLLLQVMDPGPGLLLVVGGSGHVSVKAGVVVDDAAADEAELHPGRSFTAFASRVWTWLHKQWCVTCWEHKGGGGGG
jgi:hypothetical protein